MGSDSKTQLAAGVRYHNAFPEEGREKEDDMSDVNVDPDEAASEMHCVKRMAT